jgi:L-lactate dehydrogenase
MSKENLVAPKIAIIGAGAVGSTAAYTLMLKNLASQLIVIDIDDSKETGEVMDIDDGLCFVETGCVSGADFHDAASADIIIITAGVAQKPGETRLDLAKKNKAIITSIFKRIGKLKPSAVVIMISNPVDVLTHLAQEISGLPHNQVFGSSTSLETARLKTQLAHRLEVHPQSIDGFVLGEHGDSGFVAWSSVTVGGAPISDFLKPAELIKIEKKVKNEVYDIINRKGATFFGISMVISELVEAVALDQRKIMPVSARLKHYNGVSGVTLGLPAVIGRAGVLEVWPLKLNAGEKKLLVASAKKIQQYL